MLLLDALVDDGAHALAPRLRRHRKRLETTLGKRGDELFRHGIGAERRDGHREALAEDVPAERIDLRIVRNRRAHESDTLAEGQCLPHLPLDDRQAAVARHTEAIARHAEPAMAAAATRRLDKIEIELRIVCHDHCMRGPRV